MIDLHIHTIWSDGVLVPAEMAQRARKKGLTTIAFTDHVDQSNLATVVPALAKFCRETRGKTGIEMIPGCELTHVPPETIAKLAREARRLGARWVIVHGETVVEPVPKGTNHAAIMAGVDALAHPGLIDPDDVKLAAKKGVALEITARKGHSLTNGLVAALGKKFGADLILNTDSHAPEDLIDEEFAKTVAMGAGLTAADFRKMLAESRFRAAKALQRRTK